jgi:hypothetical protein
VVPSLYLRFGRHRTPLSRRGADSLPRML